jgi:hypothetical protein
VFYIYSRHELKEKKWSTRGNGSRIAGMETSGLVRMGRRRPLESLRRIRMRTVSEIAAEIRRTWKRVNYAAEPYLSAMASLSSVDDNYILDSGREIVIRFLANAGTWRGEDARRIKAELREMLKWRPPFVPWRYA